MLDRSTHSNIENQNIEWVIDGVRPRAVRWERRINTDLVDPLNEALGGDYFAEFLIDGLLRGDLKSRMEAYAIARQWALINPNGVARLENWEPIAEEDGGDDYWRPVNMAVVGAPVPAGTLPGQPIGSEPEPTGAPDAPTPPESGQPADDEGEDAPKAQADRRLLQLFAREAAGRAVRKEVAALRKCLARAPEKFEEEARAFYGTHAALVAQTMCISPAASEAYCDSNLRMLLEAPEADHRACILDWIEDTGSDLLATAALRAAPRPKLQGAHQ
jgi:hypothetical protein